MSSVLLVEADETISDEWSAAISAAGHAVLTASGPRAALARLREGGIDLVVIDVYDLRAGVVEMARGMEALPDAPPIVLVSGSPAAPGLSARIGAATFLPKPCEPGELAAVVTRILGRWRPVRIVDDEPPGPRRLLG